MRLVPLIAAIAGCSAPAAQKPLAERTQPATETLWDRGTFVTIDKENLLPDTEESFEIYQRPDGYRFVVRWKRPAPTGEQSEGEVELVTDAQFSPLEGKDTTTIHHTSGNEVAHSTIHRELDGTISTEQIVNGERQIARSKSPNDWYIGGAITTFILPMCIADESITERIAYPDKAASLSPAKPLPIDGTERKVVSRILTYQQSGRTVIAACENGKLAGEVARGTTIVRRGDVELARVLEKWFR